MTQLLPLLAVLVGAARGAAAGELVAHQVAAPASDIESGVVRLPEPGATPTVSRCSVWPLRFERRADTWVAATTLPIERTGEVALALLSPTATSLRLFAAPVGAPLRPIDESYLLERRVGLAGDALPGWIVERRDLRAAPAGMWNVRVEADERAEGWLLVSADRELRASAFVTTQRLVLGRPIAVAARAEGRALREVGRARLRLEWAADARVLDMYDDGVHEDGAAGDGWFGALLPDDVLGEVRALAELEGRTREGRSFLRCAPLTFEVLGPRLALDGSVVTTLGNERLRITLGARPQGMAQRLHVSAEVWGRDELGREVPVCWLSRMQDPTLRGAGWELVLELDLRWLDVAGALQPLELRAVRVQDPDSESVLDLAERIELPDTRLPVRVEPRSRSITPSMLAASGLTWVPGPPANVAPSLPHAPALMLVHGYCSSGSIWPAADFTQPKLEFLDPNANRSHDQFAQALAQRAQQAGLPSFGVVAHSQGGPAALHLRTYYASALDHSTGGRRIQSLASPYQGTPLASLGAFACGVNSNMTPSGSATWLAGIPSWARAEVSYWTTSNTGSACNFLTGLLLTDPEDGTVEQMRGQLPGATNMGHTLGWCHTTGMSNPASYTDHARNQAMNAAAAR